MLHRRVGLVLAASLIAVTAVGAGIAVATAGKGGLDSGIAGRVLCPVVLERDAGCSQIRIVVRERSSQRRVATVKPDRLARFRVALEPGAYLLELQSLSGTAPRRTTPVAVRVSPHRFAWQTVAWSARRPAAAARLSGH
jgi:hypothetical protein